MRWFFVYQACLQVARIRVDGLRKCFLYYRLSEAPLNLKSGENRGFVFLGFVVGRWWLQVRLRNHSTVFNHNNVLFNRECFIKMRAAFLALTFLSNSRKDGGEKVSYVSIIYILMLHSHFDRTQQYLP